ncbi:MAG: NTF2-like N-terminal transpeptidase domain-containing protein, partial [Anaerolineales bacterium]
MKIHHLVFLFLFVLITAGCSQPQASQQPSLTPSVSPTLSQPGVHTTQAPDAESAARAYLQAWESEDYDAMYILLTSVSKDAITLDEFSQRYRDVMTEGALSHIETFVLSSLTQTRTAQVSYRVILYSVLVGGIQADTLMNLSLEDGLWRVQWDDTLIHPQLSGGNRLRMEHSVPSRGNIYDRAGRALVAQTEATALGLFPGRIDPDQEDRLLT